MLSEMPRTNTAMTAMIAMIAQERWSFACGSRQGTVTIKHLKLCELENITE
jgi:hypothetical protein